MIISEFGRTLGVEEWKPCMDMLLAGRHVVLTTHMNSDGDGLGSEVALASALRSLGKEVSIINPTEVPSNYVFLNEIADIQVFDAKSEDAIGEISLADLVVLLDANLRERMGEIWRHVNFARELGALNVLCIDHHLDPEDFADLMVCETYASSTGELVYDLLTSMGAHIGRELITPDVARGLYVALMTDTGSFRFPKTTPYVYRVAGDLVSKGADPNEIYDLVYNSLKPESLRLLGTALSEIRLTADGTVSWLFISQEMLKKTGSKLFDTDIIIKYLLSVKSVRIAVLMVELPDGRTKVSFRSRGDVYVNEIAKQYGGGGHKNAAGCLLQYAPEKAVRVVMDAVRHFLNGREVAGK
ncbi:phosphoesterase [Prosthecochloris sp. GSB1]|uniref:DHH family phosphoesterase n=1 Tax=Prosthecochloris sp. GSB1 TaxID=281093 RepID=UPI000B8D166C|nr:bifunctional oligoribonuclease/PAP phosphatase NrnA [Prosthecochloris sp. GSB1]ASQ90599.1 phosphoesterase [Prosthecochloris sp. GSB1]